MPYYKFRDIETGEEFEELMSHSSLEKYVEDNPQLQRVFEFPTINTTNSATFLDGHAPSSRKEAIALEKRIAKLKVKAAGTKHGERSDINKEIKTLEGTRKAPIGANKGHKE